jgi:hypothetical protein
MFEFASSGLLNHNPNTGPNKHMESLQLASQPALSNGTWDVFEKVLLNH